MRSLCVKHDDDKERTLSKLSVTVYFSFNVRSISRISYEEKGSVSRQNDVNALPIGIL